MKVKLLVALLLSAIVGTASAAEPNTEAAYKQNYMAQVLPSLQQGFLQKYGDSMSQSEIDAQAKEQAARITNCQYDIMNRYPDKIRDLGISNIVNGMGVRESNAKISNELKAAISSGELDMQEFRSMMENNMAYMQSCMRG
ncbi:hypothetical protein ACFL2V_07165 [Pseudomonadota bacterium]